MSNEYVPTRTGGGAVRRYQGRSSARYQSPDATRYPTPALIAGLSTAGAIVGLGALFSLLAAPTGIAVVGLHEAESNGAVVRGVRGARHLSHLPGFRRQCGPIGGKRLALEAQPDQEMMDAASGPQGSGQIKPLPRALAPMAAGSAPGTLRIEPSSASSPIAA